MRWKIKRDNEHCTYRH